MTNDLYGNEYNKDNIDRFLVDVANLGIGNKIFRAYELADSLGLDPNQPFMGFSTFWGAFRKIIDNTNSFNTVSLKKSYTTYSFSDKDRNNCDPVYTSDDSGVNNLSKPVDYLKVAEQISLEFTKLEELSEKRRFWEAEGHVLDLEIQQINNSLHSLIHDKLKVDNLSKTSTSDKKVNDKKTKGSNKINDWVNKVTNNIYKVERTYSKQKLKNSIYQKLNILNEDNDLPKIIMGWTPVQQELYGISSMIRIEKELLYKYHNYSTTDFFNMYTKDEILSLQSGI